MCSVDLASILIRLDQGLTSLPSLVTAGFFLVNVGLWCRYYYRSFYTIEYIGAFVLVTTVLVPFILFLSMAGEQAVLPGAGGYPYSSGSSGARHSQASAPNFLG